MRKKHTQKKNGGTHEGGTAACLVRSMKPAQFEALTGTGLLMFSAFRRGPLGLLAFLGATLLIVHAATSRIAGRD